MDIATKIGRAIADNQNAAVSRKHFTLVSTFSLVDVQYKNSFCIFVRTFQRIKLMSHNLCLNSNSKHLGIGADSWTIVTKSPINYLNDKRL